MTSPESGTSERVSWESSSDARSGIAFEHPSTWQPQRGRAGLLVAVVAPGDAGGFAPNLNIVRRVNDVQMSLDELARAAINEVRRVLTDVSIIDLDAAVVAGHPARRLLFTYRQGIYGLTGEQWVWLTHDHIWTVTAGAATEGYDDVADAFARVVSTLSVE